MSTRKLQQEFDKTNKKIAEGLQAFDDIHEKLMTTEINSQKEKLESDLKKEIKKLQRLRDQLKQWLGDNSIKLDKNLLQENRTKIEHAMDQFKDLEKTSKIKQFSNEGLELQAQKSSKFNRFNSEDVKKQEAVDYLSEIIDQLNQQNEALEVELHLFTVQLKKAKASQSSSIQSSIDEARYKVERNNTHLTKLERILRSIENENLDPEKLDQIKDDLEYYVENNQDEDYVEYDDFYDQLEMVDDDNLEVHGSISQLNIDRDEDGDDDEGEKPKITKLESKQEEKKEHKKDDKKHDKKDDKKEEKKEEKKETIISDSKKASITSISPTNVSTVLTAGSYSAAAAKINEKSNHSSNNNQNQNHNSSTPVIGTSTKVVPPGLNYNIDTRDSSTSSPRFIKTKIDQDHGSIIPESPIPASPPVEKKPYKSSSIVLSRLNNPLPFSAISQMIENSLLNCPDSYDAEKPRQYNPVNIHPSSIDYPHEPMYELNSFNLMKKLDNDTLFFCFYYSEGSDNLAKWNSAKELTRRGWVFNTELKQWFLKDVKNIKHLEPEDESLGQNYKYFDYEKTWLVRRKENFKFDDEIRQTFV